MIGSKATYMANLGSLSDYKPTFKDNYGTLYSIYPPHSPMHYSSISTCPSETFIMPKAYVVNLKGLTYEGWYLDSDAIHHLTNNMVNMHIREEFKGSN